MTRKILSLVFSLAALPAPAWAATDPVPSAALVKSVHQEFGGIRHDYFTPGRVSDQIMMGLGIPNPTKHLADGNYLISSCRRHSCDEKSALIVTPTGAMLAAGMIYLSCGPEPGNRAANCNFGPHLRIFMKQKNDRPVFEQELKDWSAREGYTGVAEKEILQP